MTLDDARARWPQFGFAVYAYEPGGRVSVEVFAPDGSIFSQEGRTESEALGLLFGVEEEETENHESVFD